MLTCSWVGFAVCILAPGSLHRGAAQAYGVDFVDLDRERTGQTTYLNIKWKRIPKKKAADDGDEAKAGDGDEAKAGDGVSLPGHALRFHHVSCRIVSC